MYLLLVDVVIVYHTLLFPAGGQYFFYTFYSTATDGFVKLVSGCATPVTRMVNQINCVV